MQGYKEMHGPTFVVEKVLSDGQTLQSYHPPILRNFPTNEHSTVTVSSPAFFFANVEHQLNPHTNGKYLQGQICLVFLPFEIVLQ